MKTKLSVQEDAIEIYPMAFEKEAMPNWIFGKLIRKSTKLNNSRLFDATAQCKRQRAHDLIFRTFSHGLFWNQAHLITCQFHCQTLSHNRLFSMIYFINNHNSEYFKAYFNFTEWLMIVFWFGCSIIPGISNINNQLNGQCKRHNFNWCVSPKSKIHLNNIIG